MDKVDHISEAKSLMLSQFDNSPDLQALVESLILPIEGIEQDIFDFLDSNTVTTAIGEILNIIGSWVGVERGFKGDEEYRQAILGKALTEASDGSTTKFYSGMKSLCQTDEVTFYESPIYPIVYPHIGEGWNNSTYTQIGNIKMAGVGYYLLVDHHLESMVPAELVGDGSSNLISHEDEAYVVNSDGLEFNLLVNKANTSSSTGGDLISELIDNGIGVPLVDLISKEYRVVEGRLVDNLGNQIVDESGNPYIYRDII